MKKIEDLLRGEPVSHILPFLWMKGEDNETIGEELDKIEECGIREVCLESRPHPDYCGPGWWENLDYILPEARKRRMRVWILDDDKFPTGHANGGYTRQPDKKKIYLAERHMDICGPCRNNAVLVENFLQPDGKLLGILAAPKPDGESLAVSAEGIINLTDRYKKGFVYFDLPEGAYRLFVLFTTAKGGGREDYMNLIDEASVRVLIDEVYEKHYERYGEYFGNTLAGFFSDEPELGNVNGYPFDNSLGQRDRRLPWSEELAEQLKQCWGDDFLTALPALWYPAGEETGAIRTRYMEEMTALVRKCFSVQLGDWCQSHGVEYIGHIIEDDNAHTKMACSIGHYFREMEGQHMAGIDVVHHQIVPGFTEPVHQWIAGDRDGEFFHYGLAKLASSAAHIQENKRGRALCEIFGNYGWAEGNSLMKWLTNHMLVRGINEFTPHAFSMSYPDRDCPPHFYARGNNPGFGCFARLMEYMNRGAHMVSEGTAIVDAAVLYHAESEWSGGAYMLFQKPGRKLMEQQLDYDVVPADALAKATVKQGQLVIGSQHYACLVLPYAERMDSGVAEFAVKAAGQGLPVLVVDGLPLENTLGGVLPEKLSASMETVSLEELAGRVETLAEAAGIRPLYIREKHPDLRSLVMQQEDGLVVMLFNERVAGTISTVAELTEHSYRVAKVYDAWHNTCRSYGLEDHRLSLTLEAGEAIFLCFVEQTDGEILPQRLLRRENLQCVPLTGDWKLSKAGAKEEEFDQPISIAGGLELPNLNGADYYPGFVGTYRYEGDFSCSIQKNCDYSLYFPEASDSLRLWVNGEDMGYLTGFPGSVNITEAIKEGSNRLVIDVTNTLVWERKDGASTHLQIPPTGITQAPCLCCGEM